MGQARSDVCLVGRGPLETLNQGSQIRGGCDADKNVDVITRITRGDQSTSVFHRLLAKHDHEGNIEGRKSNGRRPSVAQTT